jgi:hypothetical protein
MDLLDRISNKMSAITDSVGDFVNLVTDPGDAISSLLHRPLGGVIPGLPNTPRLVVAHGGEEFLGTPTIANARPGARGGGGDTYLTVMVSDSVITNDRAMNDLANKVMEKAFGRMGSGRGFTYHTVGA